MLTSFWEGGIRHAGDEEDVCFCEDLSLLCTWGSIWERVEEREISDDDS